MDQAPAKSAPQALTAAGLAAVVLIGLFRMAFGPFRSVMPVQKPPKRTLH
jgi:hypothetical protein